MQPPIPNPEPGTCPRCGARAGEINSPYCPSCGAPLQTASKNVSALKIFGAICLILLALPLAGAGACFLLFSGVLGGGLDWNIAGIGLGCLLAAVLCLWGFIALLKRK